MRTRRRLAWIGLVLCGLILAVGVASIWVATAFSDTWAISCGSLAVYSEPITEGDFDVFKVNANMKDRLRSVFGLPIIWKADLTQLSKPYYVWIVAIPLWLPLLIIAIPTAFLWWSDRRRHPPNHCQSCGYNLTGNMSGVCPECGEAATAEEKQH